MEFIYFGDHGQVPPLATPTVVVGAVSGYPAHHCIYYQF